MTREKYEGPIDAGMVFWAPDNDGNAFRRDLILGRHPFKPDLVLYEALPCPMRRHGRHYEGVGEIHTCPELNLRIVMRPEEAKPC